VRVLLLGRSLTSAEIAAELSIDPGEVIEVLDYLELQGTVKNNEGRYTFHPSG
jgi:predicted Rossmann fold nucleotide-binding protein DprA/Smf involved in DNA uptake